MNGGDDRSQHDMYNAGMMIEAGIHYYQATGKTVLLEAVKGIAAVAQVNSRASASHCWHLDSVTAINDGVIPGKSSDTSQSRLSWWDHKGTIESAVLTFPRPAEVSRVRVFWFADRSVNGGCNVPQSWRLLYKHGEEWKPVKRPGVCGVALDRFNEVTFSKVKTTAVRIEAPLQPEWSAGIASGR